MCEGIENVNRKVLITGGSGFLCRSLLKYGDSGCQYIVATSRKNAIQSHYCERDDIQVIDSSELWSQNWREVDILLNFAFPRNANGTQMAAGLQFLEKLFCSAVDGGVGAIINISSQSVYSPVRAAAATEDSALDLQSNYAVGKYAVELMLDGICRSLPHTNLRMASLIGAGFDQRITNKLVDRALSGDGIQIVATNQLFGFMDVRDAVSGITHILKSCPAHWDSVYNLGIRGGYTLDEIARTVCQVGYLCCGRNVQYSYGDSNTIANGNSTLDCSLFEQSFHWKPTQTLVDTLTWIFKDKLSQRQSGGIQ